MRTGQPGHILNQDPGFAMSEMEVVEQEHRTRLLRRGHEELAHGYEPTLACGGQLSVEGSLKFGPAPGRYRSKQPRVRLGHLLEDLGDARVRTAAGCRRSR